MSKIISCKRTGMRKGRLSLVKMWHVDSEYYSQNESKLTTNCSRFEIIQHEYCICCLFHI